MDAKDRALAVAAACGHELNNELTILFSAIEEAILATDAQHPAMVELAEARSAAQRCAWKAAGLLNFANRSGGRVPRARMEYLIDQAEI